MKIKRIWVPISQTDCFQLPEDTNTQFFINEFVQIQKNKIAQFKDYLVNNWIVDILEIYKLDLNSFNK